MNIRRHLFAVTIIFLMYGHIALATEDSMLTGTVDTNNWSEQPVNYTTENLGINLPWLDNHNGHEDISWLNTNYNSELIGQDLYVIHTMNITKIRTFCQMESIYNFDNGVFVLNESYAKNLDDFLNRADKYNIKVICVMGAGRNEPKDLDGEFHWELIQTPEGLQIYKNAYVSYINRFKNHTNILMWEIINEPYGSVTWSPYAQELHVTQEQVHIFLLQSYQDIKLVAGDIPVGFSDLEEEEQTKYQLFSNSEKRKALVDDCTDIYAMHIYRNNASQVADFRSLTNKPKWVVELGAYNFNDPNAENHPVGGSNELYDTDKNYASTLEISRKLVNSGFTLIMPWSFTSNNGVVIHNSDGTHSLLKLAQFMKEKLSGELSSVDHNDKVSPQIVDANSNGGTTKRIENTFRYLISDKFSKESIYTYFKKLAGL